VTNWSNFTAVVTGASSGIGRAIAEALAANGATLWLVGRRVEQVKLPRVCPVKADLSKDDEVDRAAEHLAHSCERVDAVIHGAGSFHLARITESGAAELDQLYRVNLRSAYVLTKALLPTITRSRGQVVFVNSTVGLRSKARASQYAASKHGLRALADSLRDEVNESGVRVLSLFLGRTATPMQEAACRAERSAYRADDLLQPEDVAAMTIAALSLPRTAEVTEIRMRPNRTPPLQQFRS
jgi:NADP-dependent 3-hydroxy acid dehydrogenase YdfG